MCTGLVPTVPSMESNAPLVGVCEKAHTLANATNAVQQISFIAMPLELFTFIFVSPSIFLGCLLGGRPIFLQKSESKFHLCAIKFPGKRWPRRNYRLIPRMLRRAFNTSRPLVR